MSKKRKSLPWFSHKLKRMVKRKARLYNNAKKTGNWTHFKTFQRECKREFKKAKMEHINSTIIKGLEENNCKPFGV
ncbi:DTW domain-containing protein 2 [Mactra antiquata]